MLNEACLCWEVLPLLEVYTVQPTRELLQKHSGSKNLEARSSDWSIPGDFFDLRPLGTDCRESSVRARSQWAKASNMEKLRSHLIVFGEDTWLAFCTDVWVDSGHRVLLLWDGLPSSEFCTTQIILRESCRGEKNFTTSARPQSIYLQHISNRNVATERYLSNSLSPRSKNTHVWKYAPITRRERFPTVQGMHGML